MATIQAQIDALQARLDTTNAQLRSGNRDLASVRRRREDSLRQEVARLLPQGMKAREIAWASLEKRLGCGFLAVPAVSEIRRRSGGLVRAFGFFSGRCREVDLVEALRIQAAAAIAGLKEFSDYDQEVAFVQRQMENLERLAQELEDAIARLRRRNNEDDTVILLRRNQDIGLISGRSDGDLLDWLTSSRQDTSTPFSGKGGGFDGGGASASWDAPQREDRSAPAAAAAVYLAADIANAATDPLGRLS